MPNPDQIDIKQGKREGEWRLEFPFNADFIDWLKGRVPKSDRHYDEDSRIWTIRGDKYLPAIEGIAVQKFAHATRQYYNQEGKLTMKNLKTGAETVQEKLF